MVFTCDRLLVIVCIALAALLTCADGGHARQLSAAIVRAGLPGEDLSLTDALARGIEQAGYDVSNLDADQLCDAAYLTTDRFDLLVLPNGGALPARSTSSIEGYLRGGGDIIALNTPLWQQSLIRANGKWTTADQCRKDRAGRAPDHTLFAFNPQDIDGWLRSSNTMDVKTVCETTADGPAPGARALHVTIPELTSYDTCGPARVDSPFPEGNALTVFSAKGDSHTSQLLVEWREKDGSRWMAVVALTQEWRQYVLAPEDFRFWQSAPNRGFSGDRFRPENAETMAVGLALTHTAALGGGRHEYWVGPFGTAPVTTEYKEMLVSSDPPKLETLSPRYKFFECSDVARIGPAGEGVMPPQSSSAEPPAIAFDPASVSTYPVPSAIRSPHPRPGGAGFDKGRAWRYIPLLEASGDFPGAAAWRGNPATLMVHADGPYKGGVWASFAVGDMDWYKGEKVLDLIRRVAQRMTIPIYVLDGGSAYYTYLEDQGIRVGARVVNVGRTEQATADVRVDLFDNTANRLMSRDYHMILQPGEVRSVSYRHTPKWWPDEEQCDFWANVDCTYEGARVDFVQSRFRAWRPKAQKHFVTAADGQFVLDGKPWKAHGINYMPSSGIGTEDGQYFEHWLGARSYDPEIVQRDLEHIKDLGFNSVSIFIYDNSVEAGNLLDILWRLDNLGMKANLSLRPGTPMEFLWPQISKIIKYYRLWDNDTVFAYDLAWEPSFGSQADRKKWDPDWEAWVVERYGSIANAEKDWAYSIPRDAAASVTNPLPHETDTDGEWRRMVAAYRRFLDTLLYKKYGEARRLVRGLDPNHLVSFRMSEAANPTYRWEGRIPYDFPYLAAGVDFLAPEAYGRIGDWERLRPAYFVNAYGRWAAPEKPLIWAEAGVNTWDVGAMDESPARLEFAAQAYDLFYKMLIDTRASGVFFWWYPGGFRHGENSDFGVINPDGTDKPVTKVIRERGPEFLDSPPAKPVDYWIAIDRDAHPEGVLGVYSKGGDEFWAATDGGRTVGLRTAGTGTTSANCPLTAVGGTPYNGSNPLQYLDAAFDRVQVADSRGQWVDVPKGGGVSVGKRDSISVRVDLTNLGEAKLLASGDGRVRLLIQRGTSEERVDLQADVEHLASAEIGPFEYDCGTLTGPTEVELVLEGRQGVRFGERFGFALMP